jgi:hypothetical protein
MSEPLESELAGVTLESDALPQEDFPPGDVRRRPEAPGNLHLGQAAAVPTYGPLQVDNEDPLFNSEFETGGGETLQTPAPSGPQTAPAATAVGVVGIPLQHMTSTLMLLHMNYDTHRRVIRPKLARCLAPLDNKCFKLSA